MSIEEMKQKVTPIAQAYALPKLAIFGSAARGELTENSDIDILVAKSPQIRGLLSLSALAVALEEALSKSVDLVTYDGLEKSYIKKYVLADEVVLYEHPR